MVPSRPVPIPGHPGRHRDLHRAHRRPRGGAEPGAHARLLTGPLCLWPDSQVTVIKDRRQPGDLPDRLVELYSQASDVALFYFVGHGRLDDEGRLCLGLVGTRLKVERVPTTSLTFEAVRRALRASPALVKVVTWIVVLPGRRSTGGMSCPGRSWMSPR